MEEVIKSFPDQFKFEPTVIRPEKLIIKPRRVVVMGMGGSHLSADLLAAVAPELAISSHSDYGLPASYLMTDPASKVPTEETLFIASSYSGQTEETLDSLKEAVAAGYPAAALATGGRLEELAEEHQLPFVKLPATGIQPRYALGYSLMALLALLDRPDWTTIFQQAAASLTPANLQTDGRALAERLAGYMPVIYSSRRLAALAYNWKIKFNETAKIPAFYHTFPELNHNEMTGFDRPPIDSELTAPLYFLILTDPDDDPRISRRMEVTLDLYQARGWSGEIKKLSGEGPAARLLQSITLADWTSLALADRYGSEPEQVPMVEEFKRLI